MVYFYWKGNYRVDNFYWILPSKLRNKTRTNDAHGAGVLNTSTLDPKCWTSPLINKYTFKRQVVGLVESLLSQCRIKVT